MILPKVIAMMMNGIYRHQQVKVRILKPWIDFISCSLCLVLFLESLHLSFSIFRQFARLNTFLLPSLQWYNTVVHSKTRIARWVASFWLSKIPMHRVCPFPLLVFLCGCPPKVPFPFPFLVTLYSGTILIFPPPFRHKESREREKRKSPSPTKLNISLSFSLTSLYTLSLLLPARLSFPLDSSHFHILTTFLVLSFPWPSHSLDCYSKQLTCLPAWYVSSSFEITKLHTATTTYFPFCSLPITNQFSFLLFWLSIYSYTTS